MQKSSCVWCVFLFTGNQTVDSVCTVLLSTGMFVGGLIGFILDNTIQGMNYLNTNYHYVIVILITYYLADFVCIKLV